MRYTQYMRSVDAGPVEVVQFVMLPGDYLTEVEALRRVNAWNRQAAYQPGPRYHYWLS